jgi:hypothetical protein
MRWLLVVFPKAGISPAAGKTYCLSVLLSPDGTIVLCPDSQSEIEVVMSATDRTIAITCEIHGSKGFCNLRVTKINGEIVLNPHVDGSCVLRLDEVAATQLFEVLGEWLG